MMKGSCQFNVVVKKWSVTVVCTQPSFWVTGETLLYPVVINHVQERGVCTEVPLGGLLEMNKAYLQECTGNICLINLGKANAGEG